MTDTRWKRIPCTEHKKIMVMDRKDWKRLGIKGIRMTFPEGKTRCFVWRKK